MDHYKEQELEKMSEVKWQLLSGSIYLNKQLEKTYALAKTILDYGPDILMLSEVGGAESLENFNKHFLNEQYDIHLVEGNSDRGIDLGYLTKKTLPFSFFLKSHKKRPLMFLHKHELKNKTLNKKNSHRFSRDVLELRVFEKDHKKIKIIFLLVHLKSKLDSRKLDYEGRDRRKAELKCLIEIFNELKNEFPETPIAITGDFNGQAGRLQTEEEFLPIYQTTELEDFCELLNFKVAERTTLVYFNKQHQAFPMQLDYFFIEKRFKQNLNKKLCRIGPILSYDGTPYDLPQNLKEKLTMPSDHIPLFVALDIN